MDINEYLAKSCGVKYETHSGGKPLLNHKDQLQLKGGGLNDVFDMNRPQDREIIRERFGITTEYLDPLKNCSDKWRSYAVIDNYYVERNGKTIAEAENACIEAIYKARENR